MSILCCVHWSVWLLTLKCVKFSLVKRAVCSRCCNELLAPAADWRHFHAPFYNTCGTNVDISAFLCLPLNCYSPASIFNSHVTKPHFYTAFTQNSRRLVVRQRQIRQLFGKLSDILFFTSVGEVFLFLFNIHGYYYDLRYIIHYEKFHVMHVKVFAAL